MDSIAADADLMGLGIPATGTLCKSLEEGLAGRARCHPVPVRLGWSDAGGRWYRPLLITLER